MDRIDRILRRAFPGRGEFTEAEHSFAEAVLSANTNVVRSDRRCISLPLRFVAIGDIVEVGGYRYKCMLRGGVKTPADACAGCDFSRKCRGCVDLQCSRFDRRDGENVWFREVQ